MEVVQGALGREGVLALGGLAMRRRGFLGTLASMVVVAPWMREWSLRLGRGEVADFEMVTAELRRCYPPGWAEELVNRQSPLLRYLKRGV